MKLRALSDGKGISMENFHHYSIIFFSSFSLEYRFLASWFICWGFHCFLWLDVKFFL